VPLSRHIYSSAAMFGLVESGGMEWSGMKPHSIVWFCKKLMELNGV